MRSLGNRGEVVSVKGNGILVNDRHRHARLRQCEGWEEAGRSTVNEHTNTVTSAGWNWGNYFLRQLSRDVRVISKQTRVVLSCCDSRTEFTLHSWLESDNRLIYMLVSKQAVHSRQTKARRVESVLAEIVDYRRTETHSEMVEISAEELSKREGWKYNRIQNWQNKMIQQDWGVGEGIYLTAMLWTSSKHKSSIHINPNIHT